MTDLYDVLKTHAKEQPDAVAVIDGGVISTYAELLTATDEAALRMSHQGVTSGNILSVGIDLSVPFIAGVIAGMLLGCKVLPLSVNTATDKVETLLEALRAITPVDSPGILHRTSGTYGARKLVARSIGNLIDEADAVATHIGLMPGRKLLSMTPLYHSLGCGLWRACLTAGATLVTPLQPHIYSRLIQIRSYLHQDMDYVFGVPYLFDQLSRPGNTNKMPHLNVTRCFAGGEVLTERVVRQWYRSTGTPLGQEYGLSEGGIVSIADSNTPWQSIGAPIPGVVLSIGNVGEGGSEGELIVRRNFEPTEYVFEGATDTFLPGGGVRTGDLVTRDSDYWYFKGRIKSVIVVAGNKVVPAEIEEALLAHPDVQEAVVIKTPHESTGETPIAFITGVDDKVDVRDIRESLELERYKIPDRILVIKMMPRTESGKVDRNELQSYL